MHPSFLSMSAKFIFSWAKSPLLILVPLILLSGCAKYKARPLRRLTHPAASERANQESVTLTSTVLTAKDCHKYLGRDVIAKGHQPLHISLANNTRSRFNFALCNLSLPTTDYYEVAPTVYTSTMGRAVGYGLASFVMPLFLIPAVVDSIWSSQANEKLDKDYARKALEDQIIEPYTTIDGLIFVPTAYFDSTFSLTIIDVASRERYVLAGPVSQLIIR